MVHSIYGSFDQWYIPSMVHSISGSFDQWFNQATVQSINGSFDQEEHLIGVAPGSFEPVIEQEVQAEGPEGPEGPESPEQQ